MRLTVRRLVAGLLTVIPGVDRRTLLAATVAWGAFFWAQNGHASLADANRAILELDLPRARELLARADMADAQVAIERARLAIYEGNYDAAVVILSRPELAATNAGAELLSIALGCARATAGAISVSDSDQGIFVRLQDEGDRALVPTLVRVAVAARDALSRDLRVDLPRPLHVEVVRDLFTLAAMTGLPESAAQTTGTVAVAKWGRVTLLSPRAVPHGYPWADTLAHELAHLAQTRASADRAPLWLQEGVAKREESRWRKERPLDDFPGADVIAAVGLNRGLGRPIDRLGASIAMLPSPEHAMVAFAEVSSFVRFFVRETGEQALPELLVSLRDPSAEEGLPPASVGDVGRAPERQQPRDGGLPNEGGAQDHSDGDRSSDANPGTVGGPPAQGEVTVREGAVDRALRRVTGASLAQWNLRWLQYLSTVKRDLPPDSALGRRSRHEADLHRGVSVGELLRARGHDAAAARLLAPAQKLAPFDPLLRHHLAAALYALGKTDEADDLVHKGDQVHSEYGPWLAQHARALERRGQREESEEASRVAIELCPLDPEVACEGKLPPELPASDEGAGLCREARGTSGGL